MPSSKEVPRICWDTCIVLDALEKRDVADYHAIKPMIFEGEAGRLKIVVSTVTIAEIHHLKGSDLTAADQLITGFFDNKYVDVWHVDEVVAREARDLRRRRQEFQIKIPDALIVATTVVSQSPILFSRDGMSKQNKCPLWALDGLAGDPPIRIVSPATYQAEQQAIEERAKAKRDEERRADREARATSQAAGTRILFNDSGNDPPQS